MRSSWPVMFGRPPYRFRDRSRLPDEVRIERANGYPIIVSTPPVELNKVLAFVLCSSLILF
jgi:hypothetical protein